MGKAVNTAKATVINGTKAMVVVNVKLLAVRPNRSSRNLSPKVSAVVFQGKRARSATKVPNIRGLWICNFGSRFMSL